MPPPTEYGIRREIDRLVARMNAVEQQVREIPILKSSMREADSRLDNLQAAMQDVARASREITQMQGQMFAQSSAMLEKQRQDHTDRMNALDERSRATIETIQKQVLESQERLVQEVLSRLAGYAVRGTLERLMPYAWSGLFASVVVIAGWLYKIFAL